MTAVLDIRSTREELARPRAALFTDVRPGEGVTALLMLANIFVILVCYSVIKTVREPLILLGGGAEVRSLRRGGPGAAADGVRAVLRLVRVARRPR